MIRWIFNYRLAMAFATAAWSWGSYLAVAAKHPTISQHDIVPLMQLRCTVCHGLRKQEAKLDLRTRESMLRGGKSGPAFVPGKPDQSLILKKIHEGRMPPRRKVVTVSVKPMEPREIALLSQWIELGAPVTDLPLEKSQSISEEDRNFWAFKPPKDPSPPKLKEPILDD